MVRHMPLETKSVGSQIALWPRKNLSSNLMCGVYSMVKVGDVQGEADTMKVGAVNLVCTLPRFCFCVGKMVWIGEEGGGRGQLPGPES